jgi:GNAT superfamily N-acetyltransferase
MDGWRAMKQTDLDAVMRIAAAVHPAFPEERRVMQERLMLHPAGCRILELNTQTAGYLLSHPWPYGEVPELNTLLGSVPALTDTYYLHDLALLPEARGGGHAATVVRAMRYQAWRQGYARLALVCVNQSEGFWRRQGFEWVNIPALHAKLLSYEPSARYLVRLSGD